VTLELLQHGMADTQAQRAAPGAWCQCFQVVLAEKRHRLSGAVLGSFQFRFEVEVNWTNISAQNGVKLICFCPVDSLTTLLLR